MVWYKQFLDSEANANTYVLALDKAGTGYSLLLSTLHQRTLVKTDAEGNVLSTWDQPEGEGIRLWSMRDTADGGHILAGTIYVDGGASADAFLIKLSAEGEEQWRKQVDYADERGYEWPGGPGYRVAQAPDGGYVATGGYVPPGSDTMHGLTFMVSADGTTLKWERSHDFSANDVEMKGTSAIMVGSWVVSNAFLLKTTPVTEIKKELRVKDIRLYTTLEKPAPLQDEEILLEDPVFIDGISVPVKVKLLVDWGDEEAGTVKFTTPRGTYEVSGKKDEGKRYTEQTPKEFDMGEEFGVGGKLTVVAIGASGRESKPREFAPIVAPPPMGIPRDVIDAMFSWDRYALEYGLGTGGVVGLVSNEFGGLVPDNIPMFGGAKGGSEEEKKKGSVDVKPTVKGGLDLAGSGSLEIGVVLSPAEDDKDSGSAGFGGVQAAIKSGKKAGKVGKPKVEVSLEITGGRSLSVSIQSWVDLRRHSGSRTFRVSGDRPLLCLRGGGTRCYPFLRPGGSRNGRPQPAHTAFPRRLWRTSLYGPRVERGI